MKGGEKNKKKIKTDKKWKTRYTEREHDREEEEERKKVIEIKDKRGGSDRERRR